MTCIPQQKLLPEENTENTRDRLTLTIYRLTQSRKLVFVLAVKI
jgi:hypothetical protein